MNKLNVHPAESMLRATPLTRLSAAGELVVAILSVILPAIGDPEAAAAAALPFLVTELLLALLGTIHK